MTRRVHAVRGSAFGPVAGPGQQRWSDALAHALHERRAGLLALDADPADVDRLLAALDRHRGVVDEVTEPRLLHGDLWTLNVLVDTDSTAPIITGVIDWDTASWGDRWADWPLQQITHRDAAEQDAFWTGYGERPPADRTAELRRTLYSARLLLGAYLDILRRGLDLDTIPERYWSLASALDVLEG